MRISESSLQLHAIYFQQHAKLINSLEMSYLYLFSYLSIYLLTLIRCILHSSMLE